MFVVTEVIGIASSLSQVSGGRARQNKRRQNAPQPHLPSQTITINYQLANTTFAHHSQMSSNSQLKSVTLHSHKNIRSNIKATNSDSRPSYVRIAVYPPVVWEILAMIHCLFAFQSNSVKGYDYYYLPLAIFYRLCKWYLLAWIRNCWRNNPFSILYIGT